MKRKLASIALCAAMAATMLTGCGGTKEEASEPAAAEEAVKEVTEEESQRFDETVTLTYLTWNYADRTPSTDAWIEGCKEKFNIEIDMQNVPSADYPAQFKTKLAADDMSDLFCVHKVSLPDYLAEQTPTSKDLYVDLSDLENVAKFSQEAVDSVRIDGELYYVPITWNACGVIYNKAMFAEYGLEVPTNYDEFMNVMDAFKEKGIAPLAGSFSEPWSTQIIPMIAFDNFVARCDEEVILKLYDAIENTSTQKWTETDRAAEAFDLGKKWVDAGYFTEEPLATDATTASQMIATGEAPMFITGNWQGTIAKAAADTPEDIGFFALPLNAEGEEGIIPAQSDEGMCVNAKGENVEAAKIAMNYYLSKEIQEKVVADIGGVPTHSEVVSDDPYVVDVKAAIDSNKVLRGFYVRGNNGYSQTSGYAFPKEMQRIFAGEITGEDMLKALDKTVSEAVGN